MTRPLLLLDVDGVLNPFGAATCPRDFTEHHLFPDEEPVRVNRAHGSWITELATSFDIAWATGWNHDANRFLAPLLNICALPVLTMPPAPFHPSAKVPLIDAYAQQRPVAWIDDAHTAEARSWANQRTAPTLLITADPAVGLNRQSIDQLVTWAAKLEPLDNTHRDTPREPHAPSH